MWLRLRQIALIAPKLAPVLDEFRSVLGLEVCFVDPGVGHFGLENALLPIGNQFIELLAPVRENTAGGRYLERRGGAGGRPEGLAGLDLATVDRAAVLADARARNLVTGDCQITLCGMRLNLNQ